MKQIESNRQDKLIKGELREQENAAMLQYLEQLQKEDWESMKKKKEQQKVLAVRNITSFFFSYRCEQANRTTFLEWIFLFQLLLI